MIGPEMVGADLRRLVLWRHGRTEWNLVGRAQGHADVPLDEIGQAQAARAASLLASYEPAFVWSSDLMRARQTAAALCSQVGIEAVLDRRLREYDVGVRQGMTREEFRDSLPEIYQQYLAGEGIVEVPGAEQTQQVRERMLDVLLDATGAVQAGQTGVLVGHGASLRTGILAYFGVSDDDEPTPAGRRREMLAGMSNCAWTVLEQHPAYGWQIVDYNAQNLPEPVSLDDSPLPR